MECWSANRAQDPDLNRELQDIFECFHSGAAGLGFEYCSIQLIAAEAPPSTPLISVNNYPSRWNQHYGQHYDYRDNPAVKYCQTSVLPAIWSWSLFNSLPKLWEDLYEFSLQHGFSQAVHDHCGVTSIFCFVRKQTAIDPEEFYEKAGMMLWLVNKTHGLLTRKLFPAPAPSCLTAKEVEVLRWTAQGKTAADIALILGLTERTVGFHMSNIIDKLGVSNKTAAAIQAVRRKLI